MVWNPASEEYPVYKITGYWENIKVLFQWYLHNSEHLPLMFDKYEKHIRKLNSCEFKKLGLWLLSTKNNEKVYPIFHKWKINYNTWNYNLKSIKLSK